MTLAWFHPGVASIKCADCQKRAYDMETGKPLTYPSGPNRELKFYDGPSHKAPCQIVQSWKCPKGDPSKEASFTLSKKNQQTVLLWRHIRATNGAILEGAADTLLADNLSILDDLARIRDGLRGAKSAAEGMATSLIPFLRR